ncbi:MAG: glycosyltransferase involved in cell wall biosynthesis [Phycisphaerales bacterium]|jgi:glycosyltransferase involved in cell wall biosynthesis
MGAHAVNLAAVAIGRNEGERLRLCLQSLLAQNLRIVYVDSGSTDGSADLARSMGATVVDLNLATPFTAARARNAGAERVFEVWPDTQAVQFIDGDCEMQPGWIEAGVKALTENPRLAVVVGTRAERHPERSIYNKLCDMELDLTPGPITWFGGDSLIRRSAFHAMQGYDASLIAGEEPDLAQRLRDDEWELLALDHPMSTHDAAMTRFSQWWKRNVRGGHAMAQGAWRHGWRGEPYNHRRVLSVFVWTLGPLAITVGLAFIIGWWAILALGLYDLLTLKIAFNARRRGWSLFNTLLWATFIVIGKWPEAIGVCRFHLGRLRGSAPKIIEHKGLAE